MYQLKIEQCSRENAEIISETLEEAGALSVTFTDKFDTPILEPEIGTSPLWSDVVVHALYESQDDLDFVCNQLSVSYPGLSCKIEPLPDKDWVKESIANFSVQQFGERLWVCPSWLTPPDPLAVNLILDPGLAFGTGTHETTALCLTWLEQACLSDMSLIDYGCGSGILALAALKLGAHHLYAVDIDEQALTATKNNVHENDISIDKLTIGAPESLDSPVNILIANILMSPLLELRDRFYELLEDGGTLVVSGLLTEQEGQILEKYQPIFSHQLSETKNGWLMMVFNKI